MGRITSLKRLAPHLSTRKLLAHQLNVIRFLEDLTSSNFLTQVAIQAHPKCHQVNNPRRVLPLYMLESKNAPAVQRSTTVHHTKGTRKRTIERPPLQSNIYIYCNSNYLRTLAGVYVEYTRNICQPKRCQ
jgi:hypothetical protein